MKLPIPHVIKKSYRLRTFISIAVLVFILFIFIAVLVIRYQKTSLVDNLVQQGELLARILAENSRIGVFSENQKLLQDPMQGIFYKQGIIGVSVFNDHGDLLKSMGSSGAAPGSPRLPATSSHVEAMFQTLRMTRAPHMHEAQDVFEFWSPVLSGAAHATEEQFFSSESLPRKRIHVIGFVRISMDKTLLHAQLNGLALQILAIGILFMAIGCTIAVVIARGITGPVNRLTAEVDILGEGGPVRMIPVETEDEIGKLAEAFNRMANSLHSRELALRESERRFRAIAESTPEAVFTTNDDNIIVYCNDAAHTIFGYDKDELLGNPSQVLIPEWTAHASQAGTGSIASDDGEAHVREAVETRAIRKNGAAFPAELSVSHWSMRGNLFYTALLRDITRRKDAEEQIHALTQDLLKVQEAERRRIALDLHDHVAQDLSTVKIGIEMLTAALRRPDTELHRRSTETLQILQGAISAVRDLAYDLRPPGLDQLGLVRTAYQYCVDFSRKHGVSIDFYSAGVDNLKFGFDTEINLFRVIQEALNNIKRHADAGHVTIRLIASFPDILLKIEDDGRGFDSTRRMVTAVQQRRMGLQSMTERITLLGGGLQVQSRPGQGTKIVIKIPYPEGEGHARAEHDCSC